MDLILKYFRIFFGHVQIHCIVGLIVLLNSPAAQASDQQEFIFDLDDTRAYKVASGILLIFPACPVPSELSIASGGLTLDPEFLVLCHIGNDSGLISVHRVPWDFRLSVIGDNPAITFLYDNDTLFAIIERPVKFKTPSSIKAARSVLRFNALRGFQNLASNEEAEHVFGLYQTDKCDHQRLALPAWRSGESDHKELRLKVSDQLSLTYFTDSKRRAMLVHSTSPTDHSVSIVP